MTSLPKPSFRLLYDCVLQAEPPKLIGETPHGTRRVIEITGGWFDGPNMSGEVLPGGSDWQLIRPDGVVSLESRYMLRTGDDALIFIHNRGVRVANAEVSAMLDSGQDVDPSLYRFRTTPTFETGAADYLWLNSVVAVATAARRPRRAEIAVFEVL
ncbi:MAG: DUF3237 domain-containing protein [Alphaproteobacteria bacterium]